MGERQEVIDSLAPMLKEAKEKGLWFYSGYQGIWFSPSQLEKQNAAGKFLWGAVNWHLRDPAEALAEFDRKIAELQKERMKFEASIIAEGFK